MILFIFQACSHKLSNILKIAPYHIEFPDEEEDEWDTKEGIRVLSIAYVPDFNSASFGIMLSPDGEAQETIRFEHLLKVCIEKRGNRQSQVVIRVEFLFGD